MREHETLDEVRRNVIAALAMLATVSLGTLIVMVLL